MYNHSDNKVQECIGNSRKRRNKKYNKVFLSVDLPITFLRHLLYYSNMTIKGIWIQIFALCALKDETCLCILHPAAKKQLMALHFPFFSFRFRLYIVQ